MKPKYRIGSMKKQCNDALRQIEEKKYYHELMEEGYTDIIKYGIAFCGKYCEVKSAYLPLMS